MVFTKKGNIFFLATDPGINTSDSLSESTEMEYLRKVLFEYMMGRETKVSFSLFHESFYSHR